MSNRRQSKLDQARQRIAILNAGDAHMSALEAEFKAEVAEKEGRAPNYHLVDSFRQQAEAYREEASQYE